MLPAVCCASYETVSKAPTYMFFFACNEQETWWEQIKLREKWDLFLWKIGESCNHKMGLKLEISVDTHVFPEILIEPNNGCPRFPSAKNVHIMGVHAFLHAFPSVSFSDTALNPAPISNCSVP
jgi:hypothetical protein